MSTHGRGPVSSITVQPDLALERVLSLEIVRVTGRAAVSAARLTGRGNEKAADQAAVDAMRRELNKLPIDGTVVIGEGERDEAPMLFIGEKVGNKHGPKVDIAVDPLEGTTLCAKDMPGAIATMAMAEPGTLLNAPDVYMEKIAIGPGYPRGLVDLDASPEENITALARAKGVPPANITALVLDRPRHADLIAALRKVGAAVRADAFDRDGGPGAGRLGRNTPPGGGGVGRAGGGGGSRDPHPIPPLFKGREAIVARSEANAPLFER